MANDETGKKITLHIKNMVCPRCILVIEREFKSLGADTIDIQLGYVTAILPEAFSLESLDKKLKEFGFELLRNREMIHVEQTKVAVQEYLLALEGKKTDKPLSEYIGRKVGKNYNYISKLFSSQEGKTIEKYFIHLRIEKVKELVDYNELSLSQIAIKLGYSSVHYLSNQFKKITGISVSEYKKNSGGNENRLDRRYLDDI